MCMRTITSFLVDHWNSSALDSCKVCCRDAAPFKVIARSGDSAGPHSAWFGLVMLWLPWTPDFNTPMSMRNPFHAKQWSQQMGTVTASCT